MKLIHLFMTLILMTAAVAYADDALVLYLPFDGSPGEPVDSREVVFEQGRLDQSAHIKPTGTLSYNVSRSIDARKGTLAFWIKTAKVINISQEQLCATFSWPMKSIELLLKHNLHFWK